MTETQTVDLSSLITPSKTVTLDFPEFDGFTVDLCHLSKEEMSKLTRKCVNTKFDRKTGKTTEQLDNDLFIKFFVRAVIKGWNGLKYKYLEELLLVDVSSFDPEDELPYTEDNAISLMKNSDVFDTWVTESIGDLENFTKTK